MTSKLNGVFTAIALSLVAATQGAAKELPVVVLPTDKNILYEGKWDMRDPEKPRCGWTATGIVVRFKGSTVEVMLEDEASGTANPVKGLEGNYFAAAIDYKAPVTIELHKGQKVYRLADGLGPGVHTLRLAKRTEGGVGCVKFLGLRLEEGMSLYRPLKTLGRRIEFIGDSITAGYGNEGKDQNEKWCPATEDGSKTYATMTAEALSADCSVIAVSGWGITRGYGGETNCVVSSVWDLTLIKEPTFKWEPKKWVPQLVVINLGTNDFAKGVPDKVVFIKAYKAFIDRIRSAYRGVQVHLFLGPLFSDSGADKQLTTMRGYLKEIVKSYGSRVDWSETPTQRPENGYGSDWHPSPKTHKEMALGLEKAIRHQMGW
jgi:lysophospholipase L1-like esterase